MNQALAFLLAREADLPEGRTDWGTLQRVQRLGLSGGTALRLYRLPPELPLALEQLPLDGVIPAAKSSASGACALICDAVIPHLDVKSLWLGVYGRTEGEAAGVSARWQELDRFPLREAVNDTCWFDPTEDGRYLSWECQRTLELAPGRLVEATQVCGPADYERSDVHVLWSLMADDEALTCVGLTYRRRRIDWLVSRSRSEPCATWGAFQVDAMADPSFQPLASTTVFRTPLEG
jgi:hypothetical protein